MISRVVVMICSVCVVGGLALADAPAAIHANAKAAAKLVAASGVIVLDVRTPSEFAQGHIAEALNLDFKASTFERELAKLDRKASYLVHCASGKRSTSALLVMQRLGFAKVTHLDGGFTAWLAGGLPVAK